MSFEGPGGPERKKERVALVHHRVSHTDLAALFEFEFAAPLTAEDMSARWEEEGSDVQSIVNEKLEEIGWIDAEGKPQAELQSTMREGRDGTIWRIRYIRIDEESQETMH